MQIRAFLISGHFRIHCAGCQDWKKDARRSDSSGHIEDFPTKTAVVRSLWSDSIAEDPAFYASPGGMATLEADTEFLPCTSGLPDE